MKLLFRDLLRWPPPPLQRSILKTLRVVPCDSYRERPVASWDPVSAAASLMQAILHSRTEICHSMVPIHRLCAQFEKWSIFIGTNQPALYGVCVCVCVCARACVCVDLGAMTLYEAMTKVRGWEGGRGWILKSCWCKICEESFYFRFLDLILQNHSCQFWIRKQLDNKIRWFRPLRVDVLQLRILKNVRKQWNSKVLLSSQF